MLEFIRATVDDITEYMKAKIDAFSDDVKNYGFGPSGYDDFEKEKENIINYPTYKIALDKQIIGGIYIDKQHQNLGIGAKTIEFIEKEFEQAQIWRLHTPYKNYRNHHFY